MPAMCKEEAASKAESMELHRAQLSIKCNVLANTAMLCHRIMRLSSKSYRVLRHVRASCTSFHM